MSWRQISSEARYQMAVIAEGISQETFLDNIWERRDAMQGASAKPTGQWPYARLADQPEARINVRNLPRKLRSAAAS